MIVLTFYFKARTRFNTSKVFFILLTLPIKASRKVTKLLASYIMLVLIRSSKFTEDKLKGAVEGGKTLLLNSWRHTVESDSLSSRNIRSHHRSNSIPLPSCILHPPSLRPSLFAILLQEATINGFSACGCAVVKDSRRHDNHWLLTASHNAAFYPPNIRLR